MFVHLIIISTDIGYLVENTFIFCVIISKECPHIYIHICVYGIQVTLINAQYNVTTDTVHGSY